MGRLIDADKLLEELREYHGARHPKDTAAPLLGSGGC